MIDSDCGSASVPGRVMRSSTGCSSAWFARKDFHRWREARNMLLEVWCAVISLIITNRFSKGFSLLNQAKVLFRRCCLMLTRSTQTFLPNKSLDFGSSVLHDWQAKASFQNHRWPIWNCAVQRTAGWPNLCPAWMWCTCGPSINSRWQVPGRRLLWHTKGQWWAIFAQPTPRSNAKGAMPRDWHSYLRR